MTREHVADLDEVTAWAHKLRIMLEAAEERLPEGIGSDEALRYLVQDAADLAEVVERGIADYNRAQLAATRPPAGPWVGEPPAPPEEPQL